MAEPTDQDLIARVRSGDDGAFAVLYRRHEPAARRAASCLVRSRSDTHDVVADAFVRMFSILRRGGGPDLAFRSYLLTCVRNAAFDRSGSQAREVLDGESGDRDAKAAVAVASTDDIVEAKQDSDLILTAFQSLPERWRLVLWHTAVEGRKPAEVAEALELSPNSVAALAYRARDGLREAYLQAHLKHRAPEGCRETVARLGSYVRGGLPRRERRPVDAHLAGCKECRALVGELRHVNTSLRNVFFPVAGVPAGLGLAGRIASTLTHAGERFAGVAGGLSAPAAIAAVAATATLAGTFGVALAAQGAPPTDTVVVATTPRAAATGSTTTTARAYVAISVPLETPQPDDPAATLTTPVTLPDGTAATVSTPAISTPAISTPAISSPGLSVPPITVPPITLPALPALPPITLPPITVPAIPLPRVTVPPVTVPRVTVPPVTMPPVTVPTLPSVPSVTVPSVTTPAITLPVATTQP